MFTSFDILLVLVALLIMTVGFAGRRAIWMNGQAEKRKGSLRHLVAYLISHGTILKRRTAGMAHLFLFWGFFAFIAVVIAAQFDFQLPFSLSNAVSLVLDVLGLLLLIGTLFFCNPWR